MYAHRASNYTHFPAGGIANQAVEAEGTITVYGVVAANTGGATEEVLIEEGDGSTIIQRISVPAGDTIPVPICFLADAGVNVTPNTNTSVTVYHSKAGS